MSWCSLTLLPGALVGIRLAGRFDGPVFFWVPVAALGFFGGTVLFAYLLVSTGGRAAGTLHNPSGGSTPYRGQHSGAEALKVRGDYRGAIAAYEKAAAAQPDDPRPVIEIARIYRDHLDDPAAAVTWFKRAIAHEGIDSGHRFLTIRELCELYTGRLDDPRRALPILARVAETREGTREGDWAARELREVKSMVFGGDGI